MSKKLTILISILFLATNADAAENLATRLSGRILLQVESRGEAWYINPGDQSRYFLNKPEDAVNIFKNFGTGISNLDLEKIPVGIITTLLLDTDKDGLEDDLEKSIGTNPNVSDSDDDGFDDKTEILNNYSPTGNGKQKIDLNFTAKHLGKIFLQVENKGEAWYINPVDKKRYFLARPQNTIDIIRKLGLGISNQNLEQINIGQLIFQPSIIPPVITPPVITPPKTEDVFFQAATAIRQGEKTKAISLFDPKLNVAITKALNSLNTEGMFHLGNIMSGAKLSSETDTKKIYTTNFSFSGYNTVLNFWVEKMSDETWKMTKL